MTNGDQVAVETVLEAGGEMTETGETTGMTGNKKILYRTALYQNVLISIHF